MIRTQEKSRGADHEDPGGQSTEDQREKDWQDEDYWEDEDEDEEDSGENPEGKAPEGIAAFIEKYKDSIARRVIESYPPLYEPASAQTPLPELLRRSLGAQEDAIRSAALSLMNNRGTNIVGEMGTGKTFIGIGAAHAAGFQRVLVIMPPHLVEKWKREVEMTVPGAYAVIVESITDLERVRSIPDRPLFVVMSRERAKLSYRWKPAVVWKVERYGDTLVRDEESGEPIITPHCPECDRRVTDDEGIPLTAPELSRKHLVCRSARCNGALWEADRGGRRMYPLADYVKHRMKGFFDLLIGDEIHEYKGKGSAQGIAGGILADACGKSLSLTGTLMGGYASTLFHLLYRFSPEIRTEFGQQEESKWITRYGFRQEKVKTRDDKHSFEDGLSSRRKGYKKSVKERPGLAPAALFHLIGNSIFLRLSDVAAGLPPYEEEVMIMQMDNIPDSSGYSQASAYAELYRELRGYIAQSVARGSKRMLGAYLQSLLSYPDGCTQGESVVDPATRELVVELPPLDDSVTYPKEQALIDLVREERSQGRRVLVYITHTGVRDMTVRTQKLLQQEGFSAEILRADTTAKTSQRERWIAERVEQGLDVLICQPRLVQTGLDLVDFPTVCWFETDYSVYTTRQASRRSWRIGQEQPVKVVFMAYENTIQTDALKLIAKKMQSSLAVEGELPDEGLSAFGDTGDDLMMTLAKSIARGNQDLESLENIFSNARNAERENEEYLVADEWANQQKGTHDATTETLDTQQPETPERERPETQKPETPERERPETQKPETQQPETRNTQTPETLEPEPMEPQKPEPETLEPKPEPEPEPELEPEPEPEEAGQQAEVDTGKNGGAPADQSRSWQEYIPEAKPKKGRRARPKPSSQSLFEWAMGMEPGQEQQGQ